MIKEIIYLQLPSNPQVATFLRCSVQKCCEMVGFSQEQIDMMILAIDEAFTNIIRHGYKMDFSQKIDVYFEINEEKYISITFEDDAPLIDTDEIKGRDLHDVKPGGLGVHFIYSIMDKVDFRVVNNRNSLFMTKYLARRNRTNRLSTANQKLLQTLLDIGRYVHQILELDLLLDIIVKEVKKLLQCESVSVILEDRHTKELFFHTVLDENEDVASKLRGLRFSVSKGIAGKAFASGESMLIKDVDNNPDHYQKIDKDTGTSTNSLLYAPLKIQKRVIGLLGIKNKIRGSFTQQDIEAATAIANTVALSIDNAYAHQILQQTSERLSETHRIKKEIESARSMHRATLPQTIPDIPGLCINAICKPAMEVGGDYYDFIKLTEEKYALAIGDVSGHGLEAGMMVSMARSCLYTQVNFSSEIESVMKSMNRMVCCSVEKTLMMTFIFSIYDTATKTVQFANAGHPHPCYYSANDKVWRFIENGEFPLGIYEDHRYSTYSLDLAYGDYLVLYSDGIIEAANPSQERYGMDRLKSLLQSQSGKSAKELQKFILDDVREFCDGQRPTDDLTLMVIKLC